MESKPDGCLPVLPPPPPPPPQRPQASTETQFQNRYKKCGIKISDIPPRMRYSSTFHFPTVSRSINYLFKDINTNVVSFYKPLQPVIQDGPCCGIVALAMAGQLFQNHHSPDEILTTAKTLNFTKKGEMFSAFNMANLASRVLNCKAFVVNDLLDHKQDILNYICDGSCVLVPYDADKNHQPCLNNGRNAHWIILSGICFSVQQDAGPLLKTDNVDQEIPYMINESCGLNAKKLLDFASKICVYAHQGKSKQLALWDYDTLILSNQNLFEVTTKYNHEDMLIPDSILSELRGKAVVLEE